MNAPLLLGRQPKESMNWKQTGSQGAGNYGLYGQPLKPNRFVRIIRHVLFRREWSFAQQVCWCIALALMFSALVAFPIIDYVMSKQH